MINSDTQIMFIHVPKTSGTSTWQALRRRFTWKQWYTLPDGEKAPSTSAIDARRHEPLVLLSQANDISQFHTFAIVRNPYTRTYSLHCHLKKVAASADPIARIIGNMNFVEFLKFVRSSKDVFAINHFRRPIAQLQDYATYTQSFFVTDTSGNIPLSKIYRFENLAELESDFNLTLPKVNVGSWTASEFYRDYTPEAIDLVKEIYANDFENFNYSLDFESVQPK